MSSPDRLPIARFANSEGLPFSELLLPARRVLMPNSPHFRQYYTAISPEHGEDLMVAIKDYLARVHSPDIEVHQSTDHAAVLKTQDDEALILTASPATIVNDNLLAANLLEVRQTAFVSSLDLLLNAYFAKKRFLSIEAGENRADKKSQFDLVQETITPLDEGASFTVKLDDRQLMVKLLPFPDHPKFQTPQLFLIGPRESATDSQEPQSLIDKARASAKRIVVMVKGNQRELARAFLLKFNPEKIIMNGVTSDGPIVWEKGRESRIINEIGPVQRGDLELLLEVQDGNVDGSVRDAKNDPNLSPYILEVLGVDVVQTRSSIYKYNLRCMMPVLPIPCYPLLIRVI